MFLVVEGGMFRKRWTVAAQGREITLLHETALSLRTRVSLHVDGREMAATPRRYHLLPVILRVALPDGPRIEATAGYARNGLTRVHRILVDGQLASGVAEVPDLLGERYPAEGKLRAVLARSAVATAVYVGLMLMLGVFDLRRPGAVLAATGFFWACMLGLHGLVQWRITQERRRL